MKTIEPGHKYEIASYDGGEPKTITFMKREGEGYPGNVGSHPGTNCQELIRVLIDRVKYLNNQIHDENNVAILVKLKLVLWLFEDRAARRHGIDRFDFLAEQIDQAEACSICGHVTCRGHAKVLGGGE